MDRRASCLGIVQFAWAIHQSLCALSQKVKPDDEGARGRGRGRELELTDHTILPRTVLYP